MQKNGTLLFFITCLLSINNVFSQDRTVSLKVAGESFLGIYSEIYNPTMSVSAEYKNGFTYGIGYMKFKPKQDTFYLKESYSHAPYGKAIFEDFLIIPIYAGIDWEIDLSDNLIISPGLSFGFHFIHHEYEIIDSDVRFKEAMTTFTIAFAPQIKMIYRIDYKVDLFLYGRYTGIIDKVGLEGYYNYVSIGFGTALILD
jgi:hypothetical protein